MPQNFKCIDKILVDDVQRAVLVTFGFLYARLAKCFFIWLLKKLAYEQ